MKVIQEFQIYLKEEILKVTFGAKATSKSLGYEMFQLKEVLSL